MPSPVIIRDIINTLLQHGFLLVSQKGSHAKYRKIEGKIILTTIVPIHGKDVPYGTFRSIVRQSGIPREDFME